MSSNGTPVAFIKVSTGRKHWPTTRMVVPMTRREYDAVAATMPPTIDGRRRQLRLMLLSAADAARRTRRVSASQLVGRVSQSGRAIRDRVSTLLRAAS